MQTIGERVKAAREKRGMKQAELARQLGCSVNAISMLEHNTISDPRASRIIGIAEALHVSADFLLGLQAEAQAAPSATTTREDTQEAPPPQPTRQRTRKAAPVA